MFAVIRTGGKQYKVAKDDVISVERLAAEPGATIELDEGQLEEVRPLPRVELHRGVPIHASAGAITTRSPPSTRQSDTACSSPRTSGATSRGT